MVSMMEIKMSNWNYMALGGLRQKNFCEFRDNPGLQGELQPGTFSKILPSKKDVEGRLVREGGEKKKGREGAGRELRAYCRKDKSSALLTSKEQGM